MSVQSVQIEDSFLYEIFSEDQLRIRLGEMGFESGLVDKLKEDCYQRHLRSRDGFLGFLVANFLHRNYIIPYQEEFIPAFSVSESLGIPLSCISKIRDNGRKIVAIRNVDGNSDLYISVKDIHLLQPIVDGKSLTELATLYKQTGNKRYMEEAVKQSENLLRAIADNIYHNLFQQVTFQDLMQDGYFGLLDALEKFDPARKFKFETYAAQKIKGAILDELRLRDFVPRLERAKDSKMDKFYKEFTAKNDREPTDEEAFAHWIELEYSEDKFDDFYLSTRPRDIKFISLDRKSSDEDPDDDNGVSIKETYSAVVQRPDEEAIIREGLEIFEKELRTIPGKKAQEAVRLYFSGNLTMKEASEKVGISESRISQIIGAYTNPLSPQFTFERTYELIGIPLEEKVIDLRR